MQGWKTALVSFLIVIFGGLEAFLGAFEFSAETMGYITMGIGAVMFVLRSITSTPMFESRE